MPVMWGISGWGRTRGPVGQRTRIDTPTNPFQTFSSVAAAGDREGEAKTAGNLARRLRVLTHPGTEPRGTTPRPKWELLDHMKGRLRKSPVRKYSAGFVRCMQRWRRRRPG